MGEVYVRVRLSNAWDVECVRRGLANADQIRSLEVDALVDTGSTRSVVPPEIVERLGLTLIDSAVGKLADGSHANIGLCSPVSFEIMGRRTEEEAYVMGDEILIGQTTLQTTDLLVDCKDHRVIPKHPDGPVFRL
jgi:clan AA aspartic protease